MKILNTFRLFTLLAFFLASCQTSKLLEATFESDTIGSAPAANLAGDPTGDLIQYDSVIAAQLVVKESATAGENALYFSHAPTTGDISGHSKWIAFRGISSDLSNTVWFRHTASFTGATENVLIDVSDGHGNVIARMRIKPDGEVGLARNILDATYSDRVGRLAGGAGHTIVFTADASKLTYNVTIFQAGGESIPPATDRPMITTNVRLFRSPANPSLSFSHTGNSNINHQYIIESVTISKKQPN